MKIITRGRTGATVSYVAFPEIISQLEELFSPLGQVTVGETLDKDECEIAFTIRLDPSSDRLPKIVITDQSVRASCLALQPWQIIGIDQSLYRILNSPGKTRIRFGSRPHDNDVIFNLILTMGVRITETRPAEAINISMLEDDLRELVSELLNRKWCMVQD